MATRFYLPSSAAAAPLISPAFDASWEVTASAIRRILDTEKSETSGVLASSAVATALNSPAGAVDVLIAQYVSAPLTGSGTISSAIKGQVRALSNATAADLRAQCVIRVVSNDGTSVVGTLIASDGSALASEFATAGLTNREFPLGSPVVPSSVSYTDGDRIVVELGYRKHENATNNRTGTLSLGAVAGGTDLAEDESTTTANMPWIEFADSLAFNETNRRVSQATLEALTQPDTANARVSQVALDVLTQPDTATARVSQIVLEVLYPSSNPVGGGARSWGMIIG